MAVVYCDQTARRLLVCCELISREIVNYSVLSSRIFFQLYNVLFSCLLWLDYYGKIVINLVKYSNLIIGYKGPLTMEVTQKKFRYLAIVLCRCKVVLGSVLHD